MQVDHDARHALLAKWDQHAPADNGHGVRRDTVGEDHVQRHGHSNVAKFGHDTLSSGILSLLDETAVHRGDGELSDLSFTIEGEDQNFTIRYSHREAKCLGGPLLPSGGKFQGALGLWDNFSVAKGMDTQAWTVKPRFPLLRAAEELLAALEADRELFRYDYQYSFSSIPKQKNTGGRSIVVNERSGLIDARRPGQVFIRFAASQSGGGDGAVLDLRKCAPIETSLGLLRIHRRKNQLDWKPKLAKLIGFLHSLSVEMVRIRHHYPQ
ncbi:MAG: hypothetical protein WBQ08_24185 [Candidatus Sulfotelmatobacter sp.]